MMITDATNTEIHSKSITKESHRSVEFYSLRATTSVLRSFGGVREKFYRSKENMFVL